jgi:hypothetical protein
MGHDVRQRTRKKKKKKKISNLKSQKIDIYKTNIFSVPSYGSLKLGLSH